MKSICWSPVGGNITSGSRDATVQVWDVITGETLLPREYRHDAQVEALAWSPNGRYIASGGVDGHVHVWGVFNKRTIVAGYTAPLHAPADGACSHGSGA